MLLLLNIKMLAGDYYISQT